MQALGEEMGIEVIVCLISGSVIQPKNKIQKDAGILVKATPIALQTCNWDEYKRFSHRLLSIQESVYKKSKFSKLIKVHSKEVKK